MSIDPTFLWETPENTPLKHCPKYNREKCVNSFIFQEGKKIDYDVGKLIFNVGLLSAFSLSNQNKLANMLSK